MARYGLPFRKSWGCILATGAIIGISTAAEAKNWFVNPGISLSGTYSDNIAPDTEVTSSTDFITQINPEIKASLEGRRVQADLDYRMQNILYARNDRSSTFHQYLARANAELLREHFFIDASSMLTQRTINTNRVRGIRNYTISGNRTDQLTASIRPSWYQPIGSNAEALLFYEHGIVGFDNNKVQDITSDSDLDTLSLTVSSLADGRRLSWSINAENQNISYDNNDFDDLEASQVSLLMGYQISSTLAPLVLAGYENNDFGNNRVSADESEDPFWKIGFRWQPNARSELEALVGDRFFGNTYQVEWKQRGRYVNTGLKHSEEIGGETSFLLESRSLIDNPRDYPTSALSVTGGIFLRKRTSATAHFEKSKTSIVLTPFYERREFLNSDRNESIGGIDGSWQWAFAPRTALKLSLHWNQTNIEDSDRDQEDRDQTFLHSTVRLQRKLGRQTMATLEYTFTEADSNDNLVNYTENAITFSLSHEFGSPRPDAETLVPTATDSRRGLKPRRRAVRKEPTPGAKEKDLQSPPENTEKEKRQGSDTNKVK